MNFCTKFEVHGFVIHSKNLEGYQNLETGHITTAMLEILIIHSLFS